MNVRELKMILRALPKQCDDWTVAIVVTQKDEAAPLAEPSCFPSHELQVISIDDKKHVYIEGPFG